LKVCWLQWVFIALISVLGLGQMLSGCGNKGDLYLPSEETAELEKAKTYSDRLKAKEKQIESTEQ
jgi:predicted small lipoprotein YifL